MAVTYQQIVENIMNMKCNDNDTMTMLQAAEKIPPQLYDKIVSISPMGIYAYPAPGAPIEKIPQIEYGTAPSDEIVTTTTGTSTTNTGSNINITSGGTTDRLPFSVANDSLTWSDASTGDMWEPPPAPKHQRKKKAVRTPIQISPRNPGMRRILLED